MRRPRILNPRRLAGILAAATIAVPAAVVPKPAAGCDAPPPMTFDAPRYVDETRAGGEPMIHVHPDGTLIYGAHAGTTHFYGPDAAGETTPAFTGRYNGQTYFWWSADNGATWTFAERPQAQNDDGSGFSDPDVAIDSDGTIYISEINLVNVAMSSSTDSGRTYSLQNFFAQTITDRQWSEADRPGIVYLVGNAFGGGTSTKPAGNLGHYLYRSEDGGKTFTEGVRDQERGSGLGDLRVDKRNGTLYELHYQGADNDPSYQDLSIAAFRGARSGDLKPALHTIAKGVALQSHWPAFDLDPQGNLSVTWDEDGTGKAKRPAGIYYAFSRNGGRNWSSPLRLDPDDRTDIWPWLAVGDEGRVAVSWFQADVKLPDEDAETPGQHGWHVVAAATTSGLGCESSGRPGFSVAQVTRQPFHRGSICMGGTACQAQGIDRRLGDYFSIEIDATGRMVAAYSDTSRDGAVALPAFARQSGGPSFLGAPVTVPKVKPKPKLPAVVKGVKGRRQLPATGVAQHGPLAGLLIAAAIVLGKRVKSAW